MILEKGDMWSVWGKTDLFCITTNATIKTGGALVMGRGIAKQARDRFPGLDLMLGAGVKYNKYGIFVVEVEGHRLGAFQVKRHYREKADLDLIDWASIILQQYIKERGLSRVDLNFPGIGYGGLEYDEVLPIVETLPDVVHVWTY